jgi:release factor glutamine methyltransferase
LFKEGRMTAPAAAEQSWTVGSLLSWTASFLAQKGSETPRVDAEVLLAHVLDCKRIVDIGTGSGNLAVALARQLPAAQVTAIDLSAEALAVARRNAEKHGVASRIIFVQGDLFTTLGAGEQFDFVVSNPPYIAQEDLPKLPIGVRDYEPRLALDGGPDGYRVFERLIGAALHHLHPGGWLIVEIGSPQEAPARNRIGSFGEYELAATVYDYSGHPRVLKARRKPLAA